MSNKNEILSKLEEEIKLTEEKLKAKKLMAKALKKQPPKQFFETKVGRAYLTMLKGLTSPFANLNNRACLALDNPKTLKTNLLLQEGKKVLDKAKKAEAYPNKKAESIVRQASELVIEMENFTDDPEVATIVSSLRGEVERLRKPRDPEEEKQMDKLVDTMLDGLKPAASGTMEEAHAK